jgi:hypothetical protein
MFSMGFLSKRLFQTLVLISFQANLALCDGAPPVVAIFDLPVDYEHHAIQSYVDERFMFETPVVPGALPDDVAKNSWWHHNWDYYNSLSDRFKPEEYIKYLEILDLNSLLSTKVWQKFGGNVLREKMVARLAELKEECGAGPKSTSASKLLYQKNLRFVGEFVHGTHVAAIALNGLKTTRFINFPAYSAFTITTQAVLNPKEFKPDLLRAVVREELRRVSVALKKAGVRVVSQSAGVSEHKNIAYMGEGLKWYQRILKGPTMRRIAEISAKIAQEEWTRLVRLHPDIVFVQAAGNDAAYVEEFKYSQFKNHEPNVLIVGATTLSGELAGFSNRSMDYVDVAAWGATVPSAVPGDAYIHLNGTSMATPMVTNALLQILEENPHLSAPELIDHFFASDHLILNDSLSENVRMGRVLAIHNQKIKMLLDAYSLQQSGFRPCQKLLIER